MGLVTLYSSKAHQGYPGRIEAAKITGSCTDSTGRVASRGTLISYDSDIIINGIDEPLETKCLVRIGSIQGKPDILNTYYLSHEVPKNFNGLGPDDYILLGLWNQSMDAALRARSSVAPPPFDPIKKIEIFYNPGDLRIVVRFDEMFMGNFTLFNDQEAGPYDPRQYNGRGIEVALNHLLSIPDNSKLALYKNQLQLKSLEDEVKLMGKVPVRMQPFTPKVD